MVCCMVPNPTNVVRSGTTGWRPVPLSATCHHAPWPTCVGSLGAVTVDGHAGHRAAEGGLLARLPVVVTPPAMHRAVGELDDVVGERVLLHGHAEDTGAEQHIGTAVHAGHDRATEPGTGSGRGRG